MRVIVSSLLVVGLGACTDAGTDIVYNQAPRADMRLTKTDATLSHTSSTEWTLEKAGSVGVQTVTWQVTAEQGQTTSGILIFNGLFKVVNRGNAGATIGNIVVNLQTRINNKWITRSSVIADATQDDDATTANISKKGSSEGRSTFTESSASGSLLFTDATTNSTFALVPQVTIAPDEHKKLRFSASFDNNVLDIPVGTKVRAEIIVSFGNAKSSGDTTANVDINGNGIIDSDEKYVKSISATVIANVPPQVPSNQMVTLTDEPEDITTTGTVTFSNPVIVINGTTAFVTVTYNGGTQGGTITNCAHLTSAGQKTTVENDEFSNVNPIDLTTCSTLTIGPHTCVPGTIGCGWEDDDVITFIQDDWGSATTSAGILLADHFDNVYASSFGIVEVGIPGMTGFSMQFSSANAIFAYQPASGTPAPLDADLSDPTSSASGIFGGEVLALRVNIDFSDAGHTRGSSNLPFGNLRLCGITNGPNNVTVREFLAIANTALGGGFTPYTIQDLSDLTQNLNNAFSDGAPSTFAQTHLFNGACPP